MLAHVKHVVAVAHGILHEAVKRIRRSPKWRGVEKAHLKREPRCRACNGINHVAVHHIQPFHLHPELELDEKNLITLCMGRYECHLRVGHGGSFRCYNPNVVTDAISAKASAWNRVQVEKRARATRLR